MKYAAAIIASIVPLALAYLEHENAKYSRSETIEVAKVLSNACIRTNGYVPAPEWDQ